MKVVALLSVFILITLSQGLEISDVEPIFSPIEENRDHNSLNESLQCLINTGTHVEDILKMVKQIGEDSFTGKVSDIFKIVEDIFGILGKCNSLFCYGPSYEKCQRENPQGCEKNGLLIYPKCQLGYTNWDCCVCANECPSGFRDDGLYCAKPGAYGRGGGYVIWDGGKCRSQNPQGCEKYGAIWYPKCKPGYHNVGCCICSPNCPSGWQDIGVSCKKPDSYGRGVGYPVSAGLQCIVRSVEGQIHNVCSDYVGDIEILEHLVEAKLALARLHPSKYQPGFIEQLKLLAEYLENFATFCGDEFIV